MAQLIVAAAGAAVGFAFGGPMGALRGALLGFSLGGALFAKGTTQYNTQQPMTDLRVTGTEYGQPIPWVRGAAGIAGQMWWNSDRIPISTVTSQSSGGKGGGGQTTVTTTITYEIDMLIGLSDNVIAGIARIWDNGKLIWNATDGASAATINASGSTEHWTRMTIYTGASSQLPDPTYETAVGAGNAPAYRGRGYVFFEGFKLGQSGQVPNLTFEVVKDGVTFRSQDPFTPLTMSSTDFWRYAQADGVIIAVNYSAGTNVAISSDGGNTWSYSSPFGGSNGARTIGVGYVSGLPRWVVFTTTGGFAHKTWTSDNFGASWIERSTVSLGTLLTSCSWGQGVFVVTMENTNTSLSSDNAESWTTRSLPVTAQWQASLWSEYIGKFFIFSNSNVGNQVCVSADGVNWSVKTTPTTNGVFNIQTHSVAYDGENTFLCAGGATGADSGKWALVSYDAGVTWETYTLPNYPTESMSGGCPAAYILGIWVIAAATGKIITTTDLTQTWTVWTGAAANQRWIAYDDINIRILVRTITTQYLYASQLSLIDLITKNPPTISDVQSSICLRAGLSASQFDVTALSSITRLVDSFVWGGVSSARAETEKLMATYFYEAVLSDKIYFRPRGVASVVTIPYLDLGAAQGDDRPEPFILKQANDLEIPAQIALTYINIDNDYQTATEYSDRLISSTDWTVAAVNIPIGFSPSDAKSIADVMLLDQVASRFSTSISLLGNYARLEPTDPVTITDSAGSTFRMRLVNKTDSYPVLTFDAVMDDTSILSSQGITSTDYTSSTEVLAPPDTVMELMDISILRDADDDAGFYAATKGSTIPYPGSAIFKSNDDVTYSLQTTIDESAVIGACTTTLGNWTGARVFDETNTVTVNVGNGELASSTRAEVLNGLATNAMLIGSEIIQFRTATLSSPGIYVLSGLLRGGRGTEWAMTGHVASERCVLLRESGLRRIVTGNGELGISKYYKGVTRGRLISSATGEAFTNNAIGLKPFSPFDLRASRDGSNNVTLTWQRRTRLSIRMIGALGISVPLGEESESYEVDIYSNDTYTTVVRTISATSATAAYTATEQTNDGLTPGNPIYAHVYQLSAIVGRGYELEAAA